MSIENESPQPQETEKDNVSIFSGVEDLSMLSVGGGSGGQCSPDREDTVSNHSVASSCVSSSASLVMKYAESEKRCIQLGKEKDELRKTVSSLVKDKQELADKCEQLRGELRQTCGELRQEIDGYKRENDKLREEKIMTESRLSVMQGTKMNLAKEIELANAAKEQLMRENETLAKQVSELSAMAKPIEHVVEQPPDRSAQLQRELAILNSQLRDMFEERTSLRDSVKCLQQERALLETNLDKTRKELENMTNLYKNQADELAKLRNTLSELKKTRKEKIESQEKIVSLSNEVSELQAELFASKTKQEELLLFTSRLTEKNIEMKSENQALEDRLHKLNEEYEQLLGEFEQLNSRLASDQEKVVEMTQRFRDTALAEKNLNDEVDSLREQLQTKESELSETRTLLLDERDENATLKKKHAAIVKDMGRQLQTMQKKLELSARSLHDIKSAVSTFRHEYACNSNEYTTFGFHDSANNLVNNNNSRRQLNVLTMLGGSDENNNNQSTSPPPTDCDNDDDSAAGKYYVGDVKKLIEKTMKLQSELEDKNDQIELLVTRIRDLHLQLESRPPPKSLQNSYFEDDQEVEIRM